MIAYTRPLVFGAVATVAIFGSAAFMYDRHADKAWRFLRQTSSSWWPKILGSQKSSSDDDLATAKRILSLEKNREWINRVAARLTDWHDQYHMPNVLREAGFRVANKWASMSDAEKTLAGLIAVNTVVFGLWQVPHLAPFMQRWFLHYPGSGLSITLLTSCFSHKEFFHFSLNMIGLWSFGGVLHDHLGRQQFLALYLSTGIGANVASHVFHLLARHRRPLIPGLGASGALYGLLSGAALLYPQANVCIAFLPFINFQLGHVLPVMMGFDFAGLLLGWRVFDHAAHLAGACIGLAYIEHGKEKIWHPLVRRIHEWRHRPVRS